MIGDATDLIISHGCSARHSERLPRLLAALPASAKNPGRGRRSHERLEPVA